MIEGACAEEEAVKVVGLVKEVRGKRGERLRVLDNVNLKAPAGARVAVIGPSGCGKTVLFKVLSTIYAPDRGEVKVLGLDVVKQAGKVRRLVSFVSPSLGFHKKMSLDETLKFLSKVQGSNPEVAYRFLDFIKMDGLRERMIEGFSAGQLAAVRLAVGLMKQPKLLLLDEPTANLDVARKELVVEYLSRNVGDATMMIVDHDPKVVNRLCNQAVLMQAGGRVVKTCDYQSLLKSFPFKYRFNLKVYSGPRLSKDAISKLGYPFQVMGNVVRFLLSSKEELKGLVEKLIDKKGLLSFEVSSISMEDIYYWMSQQVNEAAPSVAEPLVGKAAATACNSKDAKSPPA